jgi:hypothetical protein
MRWLNRLLRRTMNHEQREERPMQASTVSPSAETRRAERAAEDAALHLQESRSRRYTVDARARQVVLLTEENHFAELIRDALGRNR